MSASLTRTPSTHKPRILFLYGSLRERSYSRLLAEEASRIISELGAETRFFDPRELPLVDSVTADHPKVVELRTLSQWSEGLANRPRFITRLPGVSSKLSPVRDPRSAPKSAARAVVGVPRVPGALVPVPLERDRDRSVFFGRSDSFRRLRLPAQISISKRPCGRLSS
jgi:hypothetical protein